MYKQIKYIVLLASLFLGSCNKDFLNQKPDDVISEELVTGSVDKLNRLLTGTYNEISSPNYLGRLLQKRAAVKSPDFRFVQTIYNPRNYEQVEYRYEETANNNGGAGDMWQQCYKVIGNLNLILANIDQAQGDPALSQTIKGQAFALRAMVYFDLARTFAYPWIRSSGSSQGLPLKLDPTQVVTTRSTLAQTYQQILADFQQAELLLPEEEPLADSQMYITRTAIHALRSRVYLYMQDWENALLEAQAVMAQMPQEKLMTPAAYRFSDFSSESIFELKVDQDNSAGSNGLGAQFDFRQGGQGDVLATATFTALLNEYSGDPRAALLLLDKEGNSNSFVKYVNRSGGTGLSIHNIPIIRLSEIYLIAAEACANGASGGEAEAREYLNTLVKQRTDNFSKYQVTQSGASLLERIYRERRRELALEGHEVYDLIRTARDITREQRDHVNAGVNAKNLNIKADSPKTIYPIPAAEILASGMQQTQGYE